MVRKLTRNREAEEYTNDLIPKDTIVVCGVTSVESAVQTQGFGKFKGRPLDQHKVTMEVIAGDFAGISFTTKFNNNTDRMGTSATPYEPWPYGNSRKYCELCAACIDGVTEEDLLVPEENEIEEWAETNFRGKVVAVTVGTYTFDSRDQKGDDGKPKKITIQTVKTVQPITDDLKKELAAPIAQFTATMAAVSGGAEQGTLGGGEDEPPF